MVGECRGKKFGSKLRASPPLGLNGDGPGCPAGPFFGAGLPTPGPPPTVARSDTAPDLGQTGPHQSSSSTAAKDKKKKVSTPGIRGACRGSILHGSLPVEALILPGPASKNGQTVQGWGAPPTPARSGDRWRARWRQRWGCS